MVSSVSSAISKLGKVHGIVWQRVEFSFVWSVLSLFVNDVSLSENLTSERCFTTVAAR